MFDEVIRQMVLSVLVVEDSESVRYLYKEVLIRLGAVSVEAENGEAAIDYLQANAPDFVILDILLPGIQGTHVIDYIGHTPHLRNTRIIIITAHDRFRQIPLRPGDHFILKPMTINQLRAIIQPAHSSV